MNDQNKVPVHITVDRGVAAEIDAAATRQRTTRSWIVNSVLRDAIAMGALRVNFVPPRWDGRHLQVVLDLAHTVEEVKDLVYTVLQKGWPLSWDSPVGDWEEPYLRELKVAVESRLTHLRTLNSRVKPGKKAT